jgi:hypothetical protein
MAARTTPRSVHPENLIAELHLSPSQGKQSMSIASISSLKLVKMLSVLAAILQDWPSGYVFIAILVCANGH